MGNAQVTTLGCCEGDKFTHTQEDHDEEHVKEELTANEADWQLSHEQKTIVRESWNILKSDIEHVGTVTFLRMFETHPETLRAFIPEVEHIKEIELDEWYRQKLKVHAIRVMAILEKTIYRLDNEMQAAMILLLYGRRHYQCGVKPMMLDKLAYSFIIAIEPYLSDIWSRKVEESWIALFKRIVFFLHLGYPKSVLLDARLESLADDNNPKPPQKEMAETSSIPLQFESWAVYNHDK